MANENIGHIDCPLCKKTANVRATKKTKAYIHCDDCGFQGFARGYHADRILRETMQPVGSAKVEPLPMVKIAPKVTQTIKPVEVKPAAVEVKAETVEVKPAAEKTIFDYLLG